MKKFIIGVSSVTLMLVSTSVLAQQAKKKAAETAATAVKGGQTAGTAARTTINGSRATSLGGKGATAATASARTGNATAQQGSSLTTEGARASQTGSSAQGQGSTLAAGSRTAIKGGETCFSVNGMVSDCGQFTEEADKALVRDMMKAAKNINDTAAMGRVLSSQRGIELNQAINNAKEIVAKGCIKAI